MKKLLVIDGNSILNRAFYGIMGSKMLQTADGTYTNAVYGFLTIMFHQLELENPDYLVVAFDVKSPTKRHEMYSEYKGTRKGMPDELAVQLPIIKEVLAAMNITVLEKPGYEADDILGTLSVWGENQSLDVILLTGDRDAFQLATDKVTIRIPRTSKGKTEVEDFNQAKVLETYGVLPKQMIEVKGLMGDSSDNIPGVPGIGEKTALNLIKKYGSIDQLYEALEGEKAPEIKGKQREKLLENKELAYLSRTLGTIDINAPIEKSLEEFQVQDWDNAAVLKWFKDLHFKRFIERFSLENADAKEKNIADLFELVENQNSQEVIEKLKQQTEINYYFELEDEKEGLILPKKIKDVHFFVKSEKKVHNLNFQPEKFKEIFENPAILKCGYNQKQDYILLKQVGIEPNNMMFDCRIAMYLLNSGTNHYSLEELSRQYLNLEIEDYLNNSKPSEDVQTSFFDEEPKEEKNAQQAIYAYVIGEAKPVLEKALAEVNQLKLFQEIEMPCLEVLAEMRYIGVFAEKSDIEKMSEKLKTQIEELSQEIYELAGEEFNINSPKQLGEVLFEKLELPYKKKNKNGYSTDVDTLESLKNTHPIIEKILGYRQMAKLNSTFVEGMLPFINSKTKRIHTTFHQTVAATGRLSSSDPNLQNIPTRTEARKANPKIV